MVKISVISPTIRPEGLDVVAKSLKVQTFAAFEWLICSKEDPKIAEAVWVPDVFTGGFWSLNRAYNALLKQAKGELIVTYQDWIAVSPEGLQKFYDAYLSTDKKAVISGVGDQYESIDKYARPQIKVWNDPRKATAHGTFYECYWNDAEFNWAAIPKALIEQAGAFDDGLDFLGHGGDQLQLCERMHDLGIHFYLDQDNESFTVRHDRSAFGGQEAWDRNHVVLNGIYEKRKAELIETGNWPILHNFGRLTTENSFVTE